MPISVSIDGRSSISANIFPDRCPLCHFHVEPRNVFATQTLHGAVQLGFKCPRGACAQLFIASYSLDSRSGIHILTGLAPGSPIVPEFSKEINELSPDFVSTFTDSSCAEQRGYSRAAGPGYRKALEILVKDFCISKKPADEDKIKEANLGKVIDQYIDDKNIQACAKRATWLGNDETHYVRKWEDKDVEDMKRLIALTVKWLETSILTEKYLVDMPE